LAVGVKTTLPAPLIDTVPCTALPTAVTVRASPSTSESFAVRVAGVITRGVSSLVVAALLTATGVSLTEITSTLTVAVAWPPWPSSMV
jgi:hypothetical protein